MKKMFALALAIIMCLGATTALANYSEFENYYGSSSYYNNRRFTSVSSYVENNIGDGDHYIAGFDPTGYTTRDDAINMMYSCIYNSDIDYYNRYRGNLNQFADYYEARNYFHDESMWELSVSQGVINGIPEGNIINLKPMDSLTRAMAAKVLVELIDANDIYVDLTRASRNFADVYYNDWYYNYVYECSRTGLVQGDGSNFYPQDLIKRQDFLLIMYRLFVENYGMDEEDFIYAIEDTGLFVFDDDDGYDYDYGDYIDLEYGDATLYLEVGETYELEFDTNISRLTKNSQISWKSSNTSIVSVNSSGKVTAKKAGNATITATYNGIKDTIKVVVDDDDYYYDYGDYIELEYGDATLYLEVGETYELEFDTNISRLTKNSQLSWKSSNTSIVSVNSSGKVTAKKAGNATITATYNGIKDTIKVVVDDDDYNSGSVDKDDEYVSDPDNYDKADQATIEKLQKSVKISLGENLGQEQNFTVTGLTKKCEVRIQSASGLYKLEGTYNSAHTVFYGSVKGIRDGAYEVIIISVYYDGYDEPIKEASFTFDETNYNTAN